MKIAVEGCCHGELDKIYETLAFLEKQDGIKIDLLLCCGDFQAVRNKSDLQCMAVPPKYQKLNSFYKYYSGEKKAPVLTIFIGGNHEASNYLQELPYGGWVAPNIYYLGYAGVIQYGGIRIGGLTGIFKPQDYNRGHFEILPYGEDTKRSVYHIRNLEVFRLKQISKPVDIMMSHDWPRNIHSYGNVQALLKRKPFFKDDIESGKLGSQPAEELLHKLKPEYWFSAHLHCRFAASVQHQTSDGSRKITKFLALDKCLPKRKFLQVVDVPHSKPLQLELDPEWLAILKSTDHLVSWRRSARFMPGPGCAERFDFTVTDEEIQQLQDDFGNMFKIPENFSRTAPVHTHQNGKPSAPELFTNPQTTLICEMLGVTDPVEAILGKVSTSVSMSPSVSSQSSQEDMSQDSIDSEAIAGCSQSSDDATFNYANQTINPDEIDLEDDVEEDENGIKGDNDKMTSSTPLRSSLSLPNPIRTSDFDTSIGSTSGDLKRLSPKRLDSELSSASDGGASPLQKSDQSDAVPSKRFKRRNMSIYTSSQSGEDF